MHRLFRIRPAALMAAVSISVLAGCASEAPRRLPPRPGPIITPSAAPAAADYLASAASIDLFEVRSSQMALTRARNLRLREFASMMISAHTGTAAQLSMAGRRLNLLPSAALLPRHQRMLDELASAVDFDFA